MVRSNGGPLERTVQEILRPLVSSSRLDGATDAVVAALHKAYTIAPRRARPRRETRRAILLRLPEIGVHKTLVRGGKSFTLRVLDEHTVEVESDELVERYESLKQAAIVICGYVPSVGGWKFFFGEATRDEVTQLYGKERP